MIESEISQQWYWASVIFIGILDPSDGFPASKQRTVFLVQASNSEQAGIIAKKIAEEKQHSYRTATDSNINWTLQKVENVQELFDETIATGTEVFWEFL